MSRLLVGEDVFSALDSILERINNLQQLVTSWAENLSEDNRGSSSPSSSSRDSPVHRSLAASPCPSSPSHIHLEVQHPDEEEEVGNHEQATPELRSSQHRSR